VVRSPGPDLARAECLALALDRRLGAVSGLAEKGLATDAKALIRRLVDDWLAQKLEKIPIRYASSSSSALASFRSAVSKPSVNQS
jgi:hypothetical protein